VGANFVVLIKPAAVLYLSQDSFNPSEAYKGEYASIFVVQAGQPYTMLQAALFSRLLSSELQITGCMSSRTAPAVKEQMYCFL
jgi:hypothetical protein